METDNIKVLTLDSIATLKNLIGSGGGGGVSLLEAYAASPTSSSAYNAVYTNSRLDGNEVKLGATANAQTSSSTNFNIAIGYNAIASRADHETNTGSIAIGRNSAASGSYSGIAIGRGAAASSIAGNGVSIGSDSSAGQESTALGNDASANLRAVALGYNSKANQASSVALGAGTTVTRTYEVSIGSGTGSTPTRYLANVTAGVLDTDAVNVSQLNAALARIEALEAEVATLKGES